MISIGRICVKTAGRDAGMKCVVINVLDKNFVMVDGQTRRRKANIMHLEPTPLTIEIGKGASHDMVVKALKPLGIEIAESKPKKKSPAPRQVRKKKEPKVAGGKAVKKKLDKKVEAASKTSKPAQAASSAPESEAQPVQG